MKALLLAAFFVAVHPLPANAQETKRIKVHGQTFVLPAPQGACFLDEARDSEYIALLSEVAGKNLLIIGVFAPCGLLPQIRSGQANISMAYNVGSFMTLPNSNSAFPGVIRDKFIQSIEQHFGARDQAAIKRSLENGKNRLEGNPNFTIEQAINLGSLTRDKNATYVAAMFTVRYHGSSQLVLNLNSFTLVKKMALFLKLQQIYQDTRTLDALKQSASRITAQLVGMNE